MFNVPAERRYWVVRAEGGLYYDHFVRFGIIALGHLDSVSTLQASSEPFLPSEEDIKRYIVRNIDNPDGDYLTPIQVSQIRALIHEMKIGDWVLTVGNNSLRLGRITGKPRYSTESLPIVYDAATNKQVEMDHRLRRSVKWGPEISRNKLPYGLLLSLKANQTLFNIDRHWEAVCHTFFAVFKKGEKLYLSSRINEENSIGNYSVAALLGYLNDIEVIAKELDNGITPENFETIFQKYVDNDQLTITTQAQFHSPGEIWNVISHGFDAISNGVEGLNTWQTYAAVGFSMLFGNQKMGFDGLIDLQTRQKLWDLLFERIKVRGADKSAKKLDLSAPSYQTKALEDTSSDENDDTN
jgi:predicted Mrr-cat superfamily restriction endonuclease